MEEVMMEKKYLIVTINPAYKHFTIQVNNPNSLCYNIDFDYSGHYLILKGFMIPCFNSSVSLSIYGDKETDVMKHCLKVLPKIKDVSPSIISFINNLIKKEKSNMFQVNVNGERDYSNAMKIDANTIDEIVYMLNKYCGNLEF